ncbi:3'(2'),5'-bisphosphate nucleotidase CysQ [Rhizobium rhizogenes]|uniref:3'(2'),5'-bisphosphate nucleotidase CysQ n=1 Tax=Rhizobium rhizogenes TaxID=359 RepID=A0AA92HBD5_RHIRH|nr:3'(2'),5'-bisphosphate nucleotidase CysQ [Rhizobium rhizogenes]PVE57411.1 3'(2'),5'-bisphosphate nucleotidase [Rhizobium rhizogenes]PVE68909.1 3'(2'),5'-bisphosphate nucleotidase [Agrobacterium tumefaciens]PVE78657.1 3'(2'),5'-bisphosphate nucleotidase [Sphingomonas sp. TPD3009]
MLESLIAAALSAGREIMAVHAAGPQVTYKNDCSPVTEADQRAEDIILSSLARHYPDIPVVAEEAAASGHIPEIKSDFFLVDPLDGTKEFISDKQDFTVNIALIRDGTPVLGVVYAPALGVAWTGEKETARKLFISGEFESVSNHSIRCRAKPPMPVAVISRSHCTPKTEAFVAENGLIDSISIGSSLKFCMLAEGAADVYPRFSRTMMWDTAAGDAVLRAAGGITLDMAGLPLRYEIDQSNDDMLANPDFIAWGAPPR